MKKLSDKFYIQLAKDLSDYELHIFESYGADRFVHSKELMGLVRDASELQAVIVKKANRDRYHDTNRFSNSTFKIDGDTDSDTEDHSDAKRSKNEKNNPFRKFYRHHNNNRHQLNPFTRYYGKSQPKQAPRDLFPSIKHQYKDADTENAKNASRKHDKFVNPFMAQKQQVRNDKRKHQRDYRQKQTRGTYPARHLTAILGRNLNPIYPRYGTQFNVDVDDTEAVKSASRKRFAHRQLSPLMLAVGADRSLHLPIRKILINAVRNCKDSAFRSDPEFTVKNHALYLKGKNHLYPMVYPKSVKRPNQNLRCHVSFISYLAQLNSWKSIANGKFEANATKEASRLVPKYKKQFVQAINDFIHSGHDITDSDASPLTSPSDDDDLFPPVSDDGPIIDSDNLDYNARNDY